MRRIYESDALARDEDEPFVPREGEYEPQSFRSIDAAAWSDRLLPWALRRRAVSLRVSAPKTEYERGETIPFRVEMKNALPVPISLPTASPVLWTWHVDGHEEGSYVPLREPPEREGTFRFDRGERKRFEKRWEQRFKVSDSEWIPAEPGEYAIGAEINTAGSGDSRLSDETTIHILP